MSADFHELRSATPIASARELTLQRAQHIFDAIEHHRDFELIGLMRSTAANGVAFECLIVDATCDGVPKNNPYGLRYRERLALLIGPERDQLPMVLALRKEFPQLVHQNRVAPNEPANLCLYFEPVAAVLRTWTPESFLRRIQWWIEQSARGALHAADQPLDHLFFASKFELVLPWNYEALQAAGEELIIARSRSRPDGGVTGFLLPRQGASAREVTTALLVDLTLPAVVNGSVEADPATLGQLADLLEARGVALLPALQPKLRDLVGAHGVPLRKEHPFTVVLLHVPICRAPGTPPEKTSRRAFLLVNDPLDLGVATGALMVHDGKYYSAAGLLATASATEWRQFDVMPVEVLFENTSEKARLQSGLLQPGPDGVVVGAGSLGSAVLYLWGRSGWGRWTLIDKDHLKPHNLSRHTGIADQIGELKVMAVAALHQAISHGASTLTPLSADATDANNTAVTTALSTAELVIDASAGLEYPRYASTIDGFVRQVSIFVTPAANAGVLLLEDAQRVHRLRTLEAQYYRAVIRNEWGRHHLTGHLGTFWSGASCRDISMVMPYARVMAHASTFAENLPKLVAHDQAYIRVWQSDMEVGSVAVHDVLVEVEHHFHFDGDLQLFLDEGLESELRRLREQGLPNETGGVLLGYYDFNVSTLVIVDALPAPPDSKATAVSFERGIEGLKEAVEEASRRTAGIVGYVGEWHSHPRGHSASPSGDDWIQLVHIALGMGDDGLPGIQVIVGESDLQLLKGATRL